MERRPLKGISSQKQGSVVPIRRGHNPAIYSNKVAVVYPRVGENLRAGGRAIVLVRAVSYKDTGSGRCPAMVQWLALVATRSEH